jgi:uncharacterized protein (TIGR00369 family)
VGGDTEAPRHRTVRWADPAPSAVAASRLAGLAFLEGIRDGTLPPAPISQLLGFTLTAVEPGRVVFECEPSESHYNPIGSVHGGYGATLLDSAMGCAVHSTLDAGDTYTTLEFKINFLRALTHETGEVRGIGVIVHAGRTTAIAEGKIVDEGGKLYAFATTTCQITRA